jgi:predicted alpha/beta superfamily hydrolase
MISPGSNNFTGKHSILRSYTLHFGLIIASIQLLAGMSEAQPEQVPSVVHARHLIKSQVLGEDRTILVRVPVNYEQRDAKFPVVYMLDAHPPQNSMMVGIVEQQAWSGVTPELIVVGIQNTNRLRDMTPTATERAGSGGARKFLQFIETEVVPLVEKNYRTQPYRIIAGHSLAGLFVVYSFVERPDLFDAYIAASPFLHWDNEYVVKRAEKLLQQDKQWKKRMFVGLGDEPEYTGAFNAFRALLKRAKPKNFEYEFREFKNENHGSALLPSYYAGLRTIYDDWAAPESGSLADVEAHHRKLSSRYGYSIVPPENLINQIGYIFLRSERLDDAVSAFKKNAENYPNSPNVYDSLGEAYEKAGRLKDARDNYEKGYKMAESLNDTQLAQFVKANYERVAARLK